MRISEEGTGVAEERELLQDIVSCKSGLRYSVGLKEFNIPLNREHRNPRRKAFCARTSASVKLKVRYDFFLSFG